MDLARLKAWAAFLLSDEEGDEPGYDPAHLAGAVLITFAVMGALYWLLWTLLVYEGGLFLKVRAAAAVLFTSATLADYGWEGWPHAPGVFEGVVGNVGALALTLASAWLLRRLYRRPWRPPFPPPAGEGGASAQR